MEKRILLRIKLILTFTLITLSVFSLADEPLSIAYGADYRPFAWEQDGKPVGVQKDFVDKILVEKMGLNVHHVSCPWKRCQKLVRDGAVDAFFTVPTPERAEYTIATEVAFYNTHFVMHTGKNNPFLEMLQTVKSISDLEALREIRHIHMLGSGWHERALRNMKRVSQINDGARIPLMLAYERADLYIEQLEMFRHQAKQLGVVDRLITIEEPSIRKLGWHLFIAKSSEYVSLVSMIDKELTFLKESGHLQKIKLELFAKYGIK